MLCFCFNTPKSRNGNFSLPLQYYNRKRQKSLTGIIWLVRLHALFIGQLSDQREVWGEARKPEADSGSSTAGIDRVGRLSNFTMSFTFFVILSLFFLQESPCTFDFKILLMKGSFNFAAFICVVGQKKCVKFHTSLYFVNFLHWLGLKSCDPGVHSHYFGLVQKYHYF